MPHTFSKAERLSREKVIGKMFTGRGASRSFTVFPLRVVYMPEPTLDAWASVLVSVSKSRFKRAVKRNRIKRQIREAYRLNNDTLLAALQQSEQRLAVAFIYLSNTMPRTEELAPRMQIALQRLQEKLQAAAEQPQQS